MLFTRRVPQVFWRYLGSRIIIIIITSYVNFKSESIIIDKYMWSSQTRALETLARVGFWLCV